MTNEHDDDSLSPEITAALRTIAPADDAVREAHIARALGALENQQPAVSGGRRFSPLSVAAAVVVSLALGSVIGRTNSDTGTAVRNAAPNTTITATSANSTPGDTMPAKGSVDCADEIAGETFIGEWTDEGTTKFLTVAASAFYVRDSSTCAVLETITRP